MGLKERDYLLLRDTLGSSWVLISPCRSSRSGETEQDAKDKCPFCPGSEHLTPPTLFQLPREGNWEVRVFANRYPFFPPDSDDEVYGIHEVIVETPKHDALLHEMPVRTISRVMRVIRDRMSHHGSNERLRALIAFRNEGLRGGASRKHPHTQLVGLSWLPPRLTKESEAFLNMAEQGRCPLCLAPTDPLIIFEEASFRAFSPPTPRFPHETWIAPVHHEPAFTNLKDAEIDDLASLFKKVLSAIAKPSLRGQKPSPFDYNLVLHTEPLDDEQGTFHTHIEILPRHEALAGFEIGSGLMVNPIAPQQSVSELREILFT